MAFADGVGYLRRIVSEMEQSVNEFAGQSIVVTGAGTGIGFALCLAFAHEGATVALNDVDAERAADAAAKANGLVGRKAVFDYPGDVADVAGVAAMLDEVTRRTGRIDVVVANAGITNYGEFLEYTPDAFDRLCAVNLRGSYFTAQAAARIMVRSNAPGRIILMSSVTGNRAFLNLGAYGITKAGIRHMAKSLGLELGGYGITVNAISPGATLTERTLQDDPGFEANWSGVTPTGRSGSVDDVAHAALFLASAAASQITGQTLEVDGGWSLASRLPEEHPEKPDFSSRLR